MTPNTLAGHGKRWAALARAFDAGRLPQTLLISGPPQVGKWTLARRYAQLLLCPQPQRDADNLPMPCGECRTCHQVEIETLPDFLVCRPLVSAARDEKDWIVAPSALEGSVITVEVARKFGNEALKRPLTGPRKVMVIVGAGRMNPEAQNALLKTFEEPASGLTILLLADNPSALLPTVRSRCWHLPLSLVSDEEITHWLNHEFPTAAAPAIEQAVNVAAGRPGRARQEMQRLSGDTSTASSTSAKTRQVVTTTSDEQPRAQQMMLLVERILRSQPVAALALTEEALRLAQEWWSNDTAVEETAPGARETSKADAKVARSAAARFLDELSLAYRRRWVASLQEGMRGATVAPVPSEGEAWAAGLDQIRKTRHYILRNANTNLALDVMFGKLISLHQAVPERRTSTSRQTAPGRRSVVASR